MTFKVRCYGAEKLAEQIKAAIPSTGNWQLSSAAFLADSFGPGRR